MRREHIMTRLLRAVSGKSQEQFGKETGIHPSLVAQFELGKVAPSREHLERMAAAVALTVSSTEEALRFLDTLRRPRERRGAGAEVLLDGIATGVRSEMDSAYRRLLTLPLPDTVPGGEDRQRAAELFERLEDLPQEAPIGGGPGGRGVPELGLVRASLRCFGAGGLPQHGASGGVGSPRPADRGAGPGSRGVARPPPGLRGGPRGQRAEGLRRSRVGRGHPGRGQASVARGRRSCQLARPGRLLDLEASLRRAQRRLPEALVLLDQAAAVGRSPERALLKKGYTLAVMGEYERAVETLLQAAPLVLQTGDPRLERVLSGNLALNYCHLGRFAEAAELANRVRAAALETGDEIEALRMTWTQGRIAAGLGRTGEARSLLAQARREFAARGMEYDAALALLEESALLLDEGQAAEVKALTRELAVVFDSKGVHREALAALRLFQEAAEQEHATAELARRVLRYLFRARHEPSLRFPS